MNKVDTGNLIGIKEAAKMVGMTRANFYYYVVNGRAPNFAKINDSYVFDRTEVEGWKPDYRKPGAKLKNKVKE